MKNTDSKTPNKLSKVGIISMEHVSPRNCVRQSELETFMNVSRGKYTIGLGQLQMRFCSEMEDVNSMAMTVTRRLMARNRPFLPLLGRLEYATETLLDKSKSTKTILIDVLKEMSNPRLHDHFDQLEGITNINACYGGTAAIINCVNWVREQISMG